MTPHRLTNLSEQWAATMPEPPDKSIVVPAIPMARLSTWDFVLIWTEHLSNLAVARVVWVDEPWVHVNLFLTGEQLMHETAVGAYVPYDLETNLPELVKTNLILRVTCSQIQRIAFVFHASDVPFGVLPGMSDTFVVARRIEVSENRGGVEELEGPIFRPFSSSYTPVGNVVPDSYPSQVYCLRMSLCRAILKSVQNRRQNARWSDKADIQNVSKGVWQYIKQFWLLDTEPLQLTSLKTTIMVDEHLSIVKKRHKVKVEVVRLDTQEALADCLVQVCGLSVGIGPPGVAPKLQGSCNYSKRYLNKYDRLNIVLPKGNIEQETFKQRTANRGIDLVYNALFQELHVRTRYSQESVADVIEDLKEHRTMYQDRIYDNSSDTMPRDDPDILVGCSFEYKGTLYVVFKVDYHGGGNVALCKEDGDTDDDSFNTSMVARVDMRLPVDRAFDLVERWTNSDSSSGGYSSGDNCDDDSSCMIVTKV